MTAAIDPWAARGFSDDEAAAWSSLPLPRGRTMSVAEAELWRWAGFTAEQCRRAYAVLALRDAEAVR